MNNTPVIVTGGVGYVGRELIHQLIGEDRREVHVIDNLACGEARLDQMDRANFVLHRCDIRDSAQLETIVRKIGAEVVFHLAAVHFIPACESEPGNANSINVSGTINLLNAVPKDTKFVFASTAAVYRPSETAHAERDEAVGPIDIYGYTKFHAENFIRYYHQQKKVRATIVRLFNVVGPGETNPHLVPAIIEQLAAGRTELALGNLFPRRDYVDVSDVARGFRALARYDDLQTEPLVSNLGTGISHSVSEVVQAIATAAGKSIDVLQDPARMRSVDRPVLQASTEKLRHLIDWVPSISLAESMQRAWKARFDDGLA